MAAEPVQEENLGWHRVCLNTIVRKGVQLDSERLRILPMGSRVHVVQKKDRRVQIDQPIQGWCSLKSSNGDTILTPLDQEDVSLPTPIASNAQAQTQRKEEYMANVANLNQQQSGLQDQVNNAIANAENNELQKIQKELEEVRSKVEQQTQIKSQRDQFQQQAEKFEQDIEALQNEHQTQELSLASLRNQMQELEAEVVNKLETAGLNDAKLIQQQINEINQEKQRALDKVAQADALAQAARHEMALMKNQMDSLFISREEATNYAYAAGDVVMIRGGVGIVVVRYVGPVDGQEGEFVGVQLSEQVGDTNGTYEGVTYFEVEDGYGQFFPLSDVKKRITPEELLKQLHSVLKQLTRGRHAQE